MIKERYFGNPMLRPESFEVYYARKLEEINIQLKAILKGDTPFTVSSEHACRQCSGRLKVHSQGKMKCILCDMPHWWPKHLKESVAQILQAYPDKEACVKEWGRLEELPAHKRIPTGDNALAHKIFLARDKMGLSQAQLAEKIKSKNGYSISRSTIRAYELGENYPPEHILKQLRNVLDLEDE